MSIAQTISYIPFHDRLLVTFCQRLPQIQGDRFNWYKEDEKCRVVKIAPATCENRFSWVNHDLFDLRCMVYCMLCNKHVCHRYLSCLGLPVSLHSSLPKCDGKALYSSKCLHCQTLVHYTQLWIKFPMKMMSNPCVQVPTYVLACLP